MKIYIHPEVYEPAEDTFLLLKTISPQPLQDICEIGTGCGVLALYCALKGAQVICSDINPHAVQLTKQNIKQNKHLLQGTIKVRTGDMFSTLTDKETFDIILFNPPYLPTTPNDIVGGWFDVAVNGGHDGLQFIQQFIKKVGRYLKPDGQAFFVFSGLSNTTKLKTCIEKQQFIYSIPNQQKFEDETLQIFRIRKKQQTKV